MTAGGAAAAEASCPLCGGSAAFHAVASDIEYFTTDRRFTFFHCAACDILFISPMLADQLDVIYPPNYYSFHADAPKGLVVRIKEMLDARMLRRVLRGIDGDAIRVLDVGGGTGWLADLVRRIDPRVTVTQVVDLDPAAQPRAEAHGHRYFRGRIEDFTPDAPFDLILMLNLIEHVARPDLMLRQVEGMLSRRGRVVIKTPNFRALDARLFRHRNWGGYHCPRHFVLFNRESLTRTLRGAGLDVERFAYTQGAPFWSVSILEQLRRAGFVTIDARHPPADQFLLPLLQVLTAAFDFVRRPFAPLSQMIVVARKDDGAAV